jgi:hypothetical protein
MLPYQVPIASTLSVDDYSVFTGNATADANGLIQVITPEVDTTFDYAWLADQLIVSCTSTSKTIAKVFIGPAGTSDVRNLAAGTASGNLDFDDVSGIGLLVRASEAVTVTWVGADPGSVGTFRMQYRKLRQS